MVIKKCIICGKEFDARGAAKCCSPECRKINNKAIQKRYDQSDKGKARRKRYDQSDKGKAKRKRYDQSDKGKAKRKRYEQSDKRKAKKKRDHKKFKENNPDYYKEYYKNNRDELLEYQNEYWKNKIAELCEQYNGDLEQILESIPNRWLIREAKMQVWFNESYSEGMIAKIKSTPACEVTGEKTDDLVIHHLYSFNTHPELGNDPANMVRIATSVHNEFHKVYGYGNNTPEQWMEFIENY